MRNDPHLCLSVADTWLPWRNPIVRRYAVARLRPRTAIGWALITLVTSIFVYIWVYRMSLQQMAGVGSVEAARATIVPLIVVQGVILMVLGTGAVASGLARERTERTLDYLRLLPMSPDGKLLGCMLGLPVREYMMFALTLPVVGYAAIKGNVDIWMLGQFYVVFLLSTLVYHAIGVAVGLVVDRPWRAGLMVQGLVIFLYLVLPQLAAFGVHLFQFLTVRPAFYGIIYKEVFPDFIDTQTGLEMLTNQLVADREQVESMLWSDVPFFFLRLPPALFSVLVQGFCLLTALWVVRRQWVREGAAILEKPAAGLMGVLMAFGLIGTLLPVFDDPAFFQRLIAYSGKTQFGKAALRSFTPETRVPYSVFSLLEIVLGTLSMMGLLLINEIAPDHHRRRDLVRWRHQGRLPGLGLSADARSCVPVAAFYGLLAGLCFLLLATMATRSGLIEEGAPWWLWLLPVLAALVLAAAALAREVLEKQVFVFILFGTWVVPLMVLAVAATGYINRIEMGVWLALPSPAAMAYMLGAEQVMPATSMLKQDVPLVPVAVRRDLPMMLAVMLAGYGMLAAALGWRWWRVRVTALEAG